MTLNSIALVVDDNYGIRELLSYLLHFAGWEAHTASDGQEALDLLRERQYDVVLLDIDMPRMDGVTALRLLRELHPHMKIVLMTGRLGEMEREEAERFGAAYLQKPFHPNVLYDLLSKCKQKRQCLEGH